MTQGAHLVRLALVARETAPFGSTEHLTHQKILRRLRD